MAKSFSLKKAVQLGAVSFLSSVSGTVLASGFQNYDWSSASLGNAHAGSAARADDASTAFTNPAGLVVLNKRQAVGASTFILGNFDFDFSSATTPFGNPMTTANGTAGNIHDNAAVPAALPALHYSHPYSQNLAFGMSMTVPFGLATDYETTSVQRYMATRSELLTVDLNPSVSYRITKQLSVGLGASAQYMRATLNKMGDAVAACWAGVSVLGVEGDDCVVAGLAMDTSGNFNNDFEVHNKADDWGFGVNAGAIWSFNDTTRLGLHYRSKVRHDLKGNAEFFGSGINKLLGHADLVTVVNSFGLVNQKVWGTMDLPEIITLSFFHALNPKWDFLADAAYTRWIRFEKLTLNYEKLAAVDLDAGTVTPGKSVTTAQNYHNTWRASVGANHHCNKNWTARFGYMFDRSPVQDPFRTARLPDKDRHWGAVGVQYLTDNKAFAFDMSYAHVFFKRNISLNEKDSENSATLVGKYNGQGNLFGAQVTWNIE